ncbi:hypothetical protein QAD02_015944 [Eretmocerus hayati]|uniref:Uncharacterized protein n=1 Tax=Eretmocerus hayati TaxID=131215 RepID=A0ACC2PCH0_9HYME|nr:hypothetical protein QAD02_015944 [Eretmocerus hayati]
MFRTCIENRVIKKQHGRKILYQCCACCEELADDRFKSVQEHITTKKHLDHIKSNDQGVRKAESIILSSISEPVRRKIVDNCLVLNDEPHTFTCHICNCTISEISKFLEHIHSSLHKKFLASKHTEESIIVSSNNIHSKFPMNDIQNCNSPVPPFKSLSHIDHISKNLYRCNICQLTLQGIPHVHSHLNGNLHKANYLVQEMETRNNRLNESTLVRVPIKKGNRSLFTEIQFCKSCNIFLKDPLMVQCHVMLHLHAQTRFPSFGDIIEFSFKEPGKSHILCLLCKMYCTDSLQLYQHLKTQNHLDHLMFFSHLKEDLISHKLCNKGNGNDSKFHPFKNIVRTFFCNVCTAPVDYDVTVDIHVSEEKHQQLKAIQYQESDEMSSDTSSADFLNVFFCFVCRLSFPDLHMLLDHHNQEDHRCRTENFRRVYHDVSMNFIHKNGKLVIYCKLCDSALSSLKAAVKHMTEQEHKKGSRRIPFHQSVSELNSHKNDTDLKEVLDRSQPESMPAHPKLEKAAESSGTSIRNGTKPPQPPITCRMKGHAGLDNILDDLVGLDLRESQQKRLPRSAQLRKPGTPNAVARSTPFSDDLFLHGQSYIDYCISHGEMDIYSIDAEWMRLLNLSLNMTLIYNSVRYCFPCRNTFPADQQALFEHLHSKKHLENLHLMETDHNEFDVDTDEFSDLKLAHMFMEDISNEWIKCYACNIRVKNEDVSIDSHSKNVSHISKSYIHREEAEGLMKQYEVIFSDAWYHSQLFSCNICKKRYDLEIRFVKHLQGSAHSENVSKLNGKTPLKFSICPICTEYWYGPVDSYSLHCIDDNHKYLLNKRTFIVSGIENVKNIHGMFNNLNKLVDNMVKQSDQVDSEKDKELRVLKSIENTIHCKYPNAKAYIFGSRISHLGTVGSDLDVFLDCENKDYLVGCSREKSQEYLLSISSYFENEPSWTVFELLSDTRIPIIKLRHIPTGLNCDISFSNGLSVEKSKLLGYYNAAYFTCRQLTLFIKKWISTCHLSGPDGITTFAMSWLVIFYLQVQGILPPVWTLLKQGGKPKIVDGWRCNYAKVVPIVPRNGDFKFHLPNFFSYYANFDYRTDVVCPFLDYVVKKHSFAYTEQLPQEMEDYKLRATSNASDIFRFDSPMCVQDPIDLSQNSTKGVKKFHLRQFRQYCSDSVKILSKGTK